MQELKNIIAFNIAELRKQNGMTQIELAEKLNYTDKAISKWERGDSIPDISILKSIADMFGVTVDYLISEDHPKEKAKPSSTQKRNRRVITLLGVAAVWLVATIVFVFIHYEFGYKFKTWLTYIYAIPLSLIVMLVFNSIWGNKKRLNFIIISLLVWSVILALYLSFLKFNLWLIFLVGAPAQVIIILWSLIKTK